MSDSTDASVQPPVKPTTDPKFTPKLNAALAKAQHDFVQPEKNKEVEVKKDGRVLYVTKYADLKNVIEAFRQALCKNGLSFSQKTEFVPPKAWDLVLILRHESGEYDETRMPINLDQAPQQVGSQLTYLKRYQAAAYFGIAADDDDDGNGAHGNQADFDKGKKGKQQSAPPPAKEKPAPASKISPPSAVSNPAEFVMPIGSVAGKKLGELDEATLRKILEWVGGELKKKNDAKQVKVLMEVQTSVKAMLKNFEPPPPPPETEAPADQPFPDETFDPGPAAENESQERKRIKLPDDFVIPIDLGELKTTGRAVKQLGESEMRKAIAWIADEMKKVPPAPNLGKLFEINKHLKDFLKSVGVG